MNYKILATGSKGNCIVIENKLALDMGISFKKLEGCYRSLDLVFISHVHSDHLNKTTIRKLAVKRPSLRFAVGPWLEEQLVGIGVDRENIDTLHLNHKTSYNEFSIAPIKLYHDVPNYGLRFYFKNERGVYIVDTCTVDGIKAKDYDLYLVESNYDDDELNERIRLKEERGEYCYEYRVPKSHLSKKQAEAFIEQNKKENSEVVFIHQHQEKG